MELSARPAVPADKEELRRLREQAAAELRGARGGELLLKYPDESGFGEEEMTALAEIDGVAIGYLEARLHPPEEGPPLCRLRTLYVEPEARQVGAGEALLELAAEWARRSRASGIDVQVLPGAREAKNFFESAGFVTRLLTMHHRFPPS